MASPGPSFHLCQQQLGRTQVACTCMHRCWASSPPSSAGIPCRMDSCPQALQRSEAFSPVRATLIPWQPHLASSRHLPVEAVLQPLHLPGLQHTAFHRQNLATLARMVSLGMGLSVALAGRPAKRARRRKDSLCRSLICHRHLGSRQQTRHRTCCHSGSEQGESLEGSSTTVTEPNISIGEELPGPDSRLCMVLAGFSFDSYTEIDKAQGYWVCDGGNGKLGLQSVQLCALSPRFIRDAFHGILRVRILSLSDLRGIPAAGAVGVACRTESGSPGGLCGSQRNSVRRGVLNGLARWQDEDDSIYLYVPRGGGDGGVAGLGNDRPWLHVDVQKANILTGSHFGSVGCVAVPAECWGSGELRELQLELELPNELKPVQASDPQGSTDSPVPRILIQLQYDRFQEPSQEPQHGCEELIDDVTPETRSRRKRFGSCVPPKVLNPSTEPMSEQELITALRRRGLPYGDQGWEGLRERLDLSLAAEKSLRDSGATWSALETFVGSSGKEQLQGALGAASSAMETLSGDLFGALGAGITTGASELPGMKELFSGDFAGAFNQRKRVMDAASTEEGRNALSRKAEAAMRKARQQAMLRLAGGMELMSVRRGAWKMLESAVLDEGDGCESFADYELLAYLEASSTNTECWVWRLRARQRLLVAFRGTCDFGDVLTDIAAVPREMGELGKIHDGFSRAYDSIRDALHGVLERGCSGDATGWELLFTGHSLGGALATLASLDVARTGAGLPPPQCSKDVSKGAMVRSPLNGADVVACTFGAPRVGSARFCAVYDRWVPQAWRTFSKSDIIPTVPPTTLFGFRHAGIGVELDPTNKELIVRGRTQGLQEAAAKEKAEAASLEVEALLSAGEEGKEGSTLVRSGGDIWSSWDDMEIAELRRVLSTGTQAVGEHMEDNYFARIQEVLSADLSRRAENDEIAF